MAVARGGTADQDERLGNALQGLTEKLVFSYADITRASAANLKRAGIVWREWHVSDMLAYAESLSRLNEKWHYELATCAEAIDLSKYGIAHNHCVDEKLIIRRGWKDRRLMEYLGVTIHSDRNSLCPLPRPAGAVDLGGGRYAVAKSIGHDKGQRTHCGCIKSKDIGEYSTCRHFCVYCYANAGEENVRANCGAHDETRNAVSITGRIKSAQSLSVKKNNLSGK